MNETDRFQAMMSRDPLWDGRFVYAVRSTGVFCRPSCPSRRPRRDRVIFFDLPEDAENAGFRPCRRCNPRNGTANPRLERVLLAVRFIATRAGAPPTLAEEGGTGGYRWGRERKRALWERERTRGKR